MRTSLRCFALAATSLGVSAAQTGFARHNFDFGAAGLFPMSGHKTAPYSPGPGWRAGYEFRGIKYLSAEVGFTNGWPMVSHSCSRFGCIDSRERLSLLDYGVRGIAPLAGGLVELSIGLGSGYVWHPFGAAGPFGTDQHLFQYSGGAAFAAGHTRRIRLVFGIRTWRDLGRPTQQWLSTTAGVRYGFGGR